MLNLKPLVAGLVEDVLRAIGEATLDELDGRRATHEPKRARSTRPAGRREAPKRAPSRVSRPAPAADTHSLSNDAIESPAFDFITGPEDLLVGAGESAPVAPALAPQIAVENEESIGCADVVPPSGERPVDAPTPTLRAGERVVRATAAGVVIRRPRTQ